MNRRNFIGRVGGVATAASMASTGCRRDTATAPGVDLNIIDPDEIAWDKAPCRYCGTGCGVEVGVHDNKVVAVRGDEKSPVNRGLLCVKGYNLPGMLYGSDRLTRPLRRRPDGSGFDPISWDEALDLIASTYQSVLDEHGPEAVAGYLSGQSTVFDGYAATKWFRGGMGSNNLEGNARLCMASAVMGFMTQFGSDEPMGCYEDFEAGHDFVLWGNNMAETHPVLFSRILENKRTNPRGVRIIDLAVRRTPTSDFADQVVMFRPGTDLALANGILHLILESDRYDRSFIDRHIVFKRGIEDLEKIGYGCFGENADRYLFEDEATPSSLEGLRGFMSDYTPERTSQLTGVSVEQLRMLADLYADRNRNTVSLWCMGVNQHVRGTWMNNLVNNLHLLTGKISRPGNNPLSLTGQPSACGTVREVGTLCNRLPADMVVTNPEHRAKAEEIWGLSAGTVPEKVGYHTVDMFRALERGDVKVIWIQTTNPWMTLPNLNRFDRTPDDGRFIIVSDIYPTPTTAMADLILPSAAWVEKEGVFGNTERRTQHWRKMVDPPGEAKEDAWQIVQVAKRMGFDNLFPWPDDDWHRPMFEEYRRFTLGTGKDVASYDQLLETRGMRWPVVDGRETKYRYAAKYDPYVEASEGVRFYKAKADGERASVWLRPYHAPAEPPDEKFPFWLMTGRVLEHWHSGSMTRRTPTLHQAVPATYVELNRADAEELGVRDGQTVRLVSRRGQVDFPVVVDGRGQPPRGIVFVPFFDESMRVNLLTIEAMDNISYQPDYKKCAVRIEALG